MLRCERLDVRYGDTTAVDGMGLEVGAGETVVLLGPSGCGKSTLLRAVAGLEPLTGGRIEWDGADLFGVPPHRRNFALMFQDYALFPHRDVGANVGFGLRMAGVAPAPRAERVAEVLALVGLGGFERRAVAELSGGEQQRVALARALAPAPRLLMLDEPLGALDRELRERLIDDLRGLLATSGVPALYVTHDHDEAFALADRVVLMRDGRAVQSGAPEAVWAAPIDAEAAAFLGFTNRSAATVRAGVADTAWGALPVDGPMPDGEAVVVLRPDALRLVGAGASVGHAFDVVVRDVVFSGESSLVRVATAAGAELELRVSRAALPHVGAQVSVALSGTGVLVFPRSLTD